MKRSTLFLILSLSANVVLALLIANASARAVLTPRPEVAKSSSSITLDVSHNATPIPSKTYTLSPDFWREIHSADLLTLAQRLRSAGFPAALVRRIVWDLNSAQGEIARAAIQGKNDDTPYWKEIPYYPDDPSARSKIREINQQLNKVYLKLMADTEALAEDEDAAYYMRQQFGDLAKDKLQQTAKITADYRELRYTLASDARNKNPGGELTDTDRAQLSALAQEEQRDLKQTLSPEEYAEYLYRSSPTANRLRDQLDVLRPSEAEYKAIFALQRSIDEQFQVSNYSNSQETQAYKDALKTLGLQIGAALGQERYADYLQAMDQTNNKLKRLVARLDLPLSTVGKITAVQTDISQQAETVRKDQTLSPAERSERLSQLALEAQTKLTETLGARGYSAYEENKGSWLRALKTNSSATPP